MSESAAADAKKVEKERDSDAGGQSSTADVKDEAAAAAAAATTTKPAAPRVAAIDVLRGFVMVLMSIDHASEMFNGGRLFTDSFFWYTAGTPLPAGQFFTRWITHLCAPTFVMLAGTALAISTEARRAKGQTERSIDRHIVIRGLLIIFFEIAWMSWAMFEPGRILFQVLWAIGASLVAMALLRRLSDRMLFGLGVGLAFGSEILLGLFGQLGLLQQIPVGMFVSGGFYFDRHFIVAYPLIPWLSMMCIGWAFGRRLVKWRNEGKDESLAASRVLAIGGVLGLVLFALIRAKNTYGNMLLVRENQDIIQWLHVSKYPPSATYIGLELGIAALLLAGLMRLRLDKRMPRFLEPLRLLGSTALFFYLLHVHVLKLVTWTFGLHAKFGMLSAYIGALGVIAVLYPACVWYRKYKAAHPNGWARWI